MTTKPFDLQTTNFKDLAEFFHENGYVILENAIPMNQVERLREDLYRAERSSPKLKNRHKMHKCFFEKSSATVDLVENSRITDFAQYILADVPDSRPNNTSLKCHVIHNNAFIIPPNGRGQAPVWHVDDPLQQVIIEPGHTLPSYIKLPVLVATYMIWLSDCDTATHGPTFVVPGSHRFGKVVDAELAESMAIPMCGKAGTAVLINANTWHRGCQNSSNVPRETLQITFARRIIGHKFKTIMNYQMPNSVLQDRKQITKERFGFLEGGAYS